MNKNSVRGHRLEAQLFEPGISLSNEEINEVIKPFIKDVNNKEVFKREYECIWLSSKNENKEKVIMTREEKINKIAGLCDVSVSKEEQDNILDHLDPRRFEVTPKGIVHKKTLEYLNSCTDEELDVIADEAMKTLRNLCLRRPLPEDL